MSTASTRLHFLNRPLSLLASVVLLFPVVSLAETNSAGLNEQVRAAIAGFHGPAAERGPGPKLRVVYFTGSDQAPLADHKERIGRILMDIRSFIEREMARNGFPGSHLALELEGGQLVLHEVKGRRPAKEYQHESGDVTEGEMRAALRGTVDFDREFVLALYGLCQKRSDGSYFFHAPYYGKAGSCQEWGFCHAADCELLDPRLLEDTEGRIIYDEHYGHFEKTLADFNSAYLGGIAHELGHGLGLPHNSQTKEELSAMGNALMGNGNLTYGRERWKKHAKKGAFLTQAEALRLASHPLITGDNRRRFEKASGRFEDVRFTAGRMKLEITGTAKGRIAPYAVIAYNDPDLPAGGYDALTHCAACGPDGSFRLDVPMLAMGGHELRLTALFPNGAVTEETRRFGVNADGMVDLNAVAKSALRLPGATTLTGKADPPAKAVSDAEAALAIAPADGKPALKSLLAALSTEDDPKLPPSAWPTSQATCELSDAGWAEAKVGWGEPKRNRTGGPAVLMGSLLKVDGQIQSRGLYAHSPASHIFVLDGKWSTFTARAAIQDGDGQQRRAKFIVVGDGKELHRTEAVKPGPGEELRVDVKGVKRLELRTEGGRSATDHSWAIWAEPRLAR